MSLGGTLTGTYTYNGREQLVAREVTNSGTQNGTTHFVHDRMGNVIAEADGSGTTQREYVWLPETQTAATRQSYAQVDRPVAVVAGGATYKVHVDHLNRPVMMTNAAKATVWDAVWLPWGGVYSVTGSLTLDARFPGQWFQLESGLHYNWHRHYDPSLGRYTQPDPLGFVDGPSVYGYARGNPQSFVDPDGRIVKFIIGGLTGFAIDAGIQYYTGCGDINWWKAAYRGGIIGAGFVSGFYGGFTGRELIFGRNFRIAPAGNRTGNKFGEPPHYHRRGPNDPKTGETQSGQGIGRHRPWETRSSDRSFWDRF